MTGPSSRPSLLRTALSVTAGIGALLVGFTLAASPGVSPLARPALVIFGFGGYIALVGPALDRRYGLDRLWRDDPPDLRAFRYGKPARKNGDAGEPGSPGTPLAIAILVLGLTVLGDAAAAAEASPPGAGPKAPPATPASRSFVAEYTRWHEAGV